MDLFPAVLESFATTSFRTIDSGSERPRLEGDRLVVKPALLTRIAEEGFRELSFFFRESHLALLAGILKEPQRGEKENCENEHQVIRWLLKNAVVSSKGELALCQDTGTAVIYGWKDEGVFSCGRGGSDNHDSSGGRQDYSSSDAEALEAGVAAAYKNNFLRPSQTAASSFFGEYNTGDNLPAQLRLDAVSPSRPGGPAYRFLFIAKGGGSSNKTSLFPMTKALLEKSAFDAFLQKEIPALGTAACPPYRLAVVVGGTSPELNLEVLKLATAEVLDHLPCFPEGENEEARTGKSRIYRDRYWEERAMEIGRQSGLGAQFGGRNFLLDVRVLRLPRHAASCPVSIGVSCAAHRNMLAYIDREGLHLEQLVHDPEDFLYRKLGKRDADIALGNNGNTGGNNAHRISLEKPVEEICRELSPLPVGTRILLSGKLLVARDAAHLKWHTLLAEGKPLPEYLFKYPVYYAGPSAAPPGRIIGSLGPTTAGRMDSYGEELMSRGASRITLAKGDRSEGWKKAAQKYGGFYLGTLGGGAALLAEENVTASELVDYPELGMEAVRLITVRDLPAFIIVDPKGNSFY
ncbi:MAG: fumarate hydratase C-terminal domain-containing protein [Treponema sp.]|nr:fumarate hydratase C-terminal domain-containing protein [Treponema sp.]